MIESKIVLVESRGTWPEHVIEDINNAWVKLIHLNHDPMGVVPKTYASRHTFKKLDYQFFGTTITYRMYFKNNNITEFVMDETLEDNVVLVTLDNDRVQINNVKFSFIKHCDFCPNEIILHGEKVKLSDGRLVCGECYTKVFDLILQSSNTKVK